MLPMGHLDDPLNTFWQLFSLTGVPGRLGAGHPAGVAVNGGLGVGAGVGARPVLAGFGPSQDLTLLAAGPDVRCRARRGCPGAARGPGPGAGRAGRLGVRPGSRPPGRGFPRDVTGPRRGRGGRRERCRPDRLARGGVDPALAVDPASRSCRILRVTAVDVRRRQPGRRCRRSTSAPRAATAGAPGSSAKSATGWTSVGAGRPRGGRRTHRGGPAGRTLPPGRPRWSARERERGPARSPCGAPTASPTGRSRPGCPWTGRPRRHRGDTGRWLRRHLTHPGGGRAASVVAPSTGPWERAGAPTVGDGVGGGHAGRRVRRPGAGEDDLVRLRTRERRVDSGPRSSRCPSSTARRVDHPLVGLTTQTSSGGGRYRGDRSRTDGG